MKNSHNKMGCRWNVADVAWALRSVSTTTGTPHKPKQYVFFSAGKCVVVCRGIVDKILQTVKPIAESQRRGNLYIASVRLASFHRQGHAC